MQQVGDLPGVGQLVVLVGLPGKAHRIGADGLVGLVHHRRRHEGGVHPAREERPDRNIGHELFLDRGEQLEAEGVHVIPLTHTRDIAHLGTTREAPERLDQDLSLLADEEVTGWELPHAFEGRVRRGDVLKGQQGQEGVGVGALGETFHGEEGLDLAPKDEATGVGGVIEGLDPEGVSRQDQFLEGLIPEGEGVHPPQASQEPLAPFLITVDQHLGVGLAPKNVARGLQVLSDLQVVVDLPVEDRPDVVALVGDGLGAALEVHDG